MKIEKGIPLPGKKQSRISQYNFIDAMDVGDSVEVKGDIARAGITQRMRKHGWQPTYRKMRHSSENFPVLYRIWRVA